LPNKKIYLKYVSKWDLKIGAKHNFFFFKNYFKPVLKFHLENLKKNQILKTQNENMYQTGPLGFWSFGF
jgi:hypothetical protein